MKHDPNFLQLWWRVLTFRARFEDYHRLGGGHLLMGLVVCWLVGMGRYWDDPRATFWQHLGIGSVVYVFALSALFWIIVKPLAPSRFSFAGILTFVVLTSPPAALYAIPVERWMSLADANMINLYFLGIVAAWRLFLWVHYLAWFGLFTGGRVFVCAVMPLGLIFFTLYSLNLHHVVIQIMGGIREADQSSQDTAYFFLTMFTFIGLPMSALAALIWIILVIESWLDRRTQRLSEASAQLKKSRAKETGTDE